MIDENLKEILQIKPCRVSRKTYLEPIAKRLKIDPIIYKNRTVLHKAIVEKLSKPSFRCSNDKDPVTLENIDEIESKYLFEWDQADEHYGADVRSLKAMIDKNTTILPWAIDKASGIESARDHDAYLKKYDMKNVDGLIEKITNFVCESYNFEYEKVPQCVKYRFQLENSTTEYISSLLQFLESFHNCRVLYYNALQSVCNQFHGEIYEGNDLNMKNVISLNLLNQISHTVLHTECDNSFELLVICINTMKVYFENNYQNIIDLFFMTLNSLKDEICD